MGCSTSMRAATPAVPNHRPTCRAGCYPLLSQVFFSIFCNIYIYFFTFTGATASVARISSVRVLAVLKSHPDTLLSSPWWSYCSYKQQAVKWALLRLVPLIVKKSKCCLIECRAAAVFSKDSRSLTLPLVRRQLFFFVSFFFFLVFCLCLNMLWRLFTRRGEKSIVQVPPVLSASWPVLSVIKITRCSWSSLAF